MKGAVMSKEGGSIIVCCPHCANEFKRTASYLMVLGQYLACPKCIKPMSIDLGAVMELRNKKRASSVSST